MKTFIGIVNAIVFLTFIVLGIVFFSLKSQDRYEAFWELIRGCPPIVYALALLLVLSGVFGFFLFKILCDRNDSGESREIRKPTFEQFPMNKKEIETQLGSLLLDYAHPVGSLYWTSSNENPAVTFGGGTWKQIKDKFIWAKGDSDTVDATGGAKTVTLKVENLPSHNHNFTPAGKIASTVDGTDNKTANEGNHKHEIKHTHGYTPSGKIASSSGGTDGHTGKMSENAEGHVTGFCGLQMGTAQGVNPTGNMRRYSDSTSSQMNKSCGDRGYSLQIYVEHHHNAYFTGTAGTTTSQNTTLSGSSTAHSHDAYFTGTAGTTGNTGSGTAINITPPFICKYCWERTA